MPVAKNATMGIIAMTPLNPKMVFSELSKHHIPIDKKVMKMIKA